MSQSQIYVEHSDKAKLENVRRKSAARNLGEVISFLLERSDEASLVKELKESKKKWEKV